MISKEKIPLVCICVPAYNAAGTLPATLDSILAQTYENIVIFIMDNASTDATPEIAGRYAAKDSRIRVFRGSVNNGAEANFTRCLQSAEGDYTAIYHSDDVYEPSIIQKQVEFLEANPGAGAVFTSAALIDGEGKVTGRRKLPLPVAEGKSGVFDLREILRNLLIHGNFFVCPSAMARTSVYKNEISVWDCGGFKTSSDLDVWLRILEKHTVGIINEPLVRYRVSPASFSYRTARGITARADLFSALDAYAQKYTNGLLSERDMMNYEFLKFREDTRRVISFLINNEPHAARELARSMPFLKLLPPALASVRRLATLMIGVAAFLLALLRPGAGVRKLLYNFRFRSQA